jgi:adhesin transport system outer membrane protein
VFIRHEQLSGDLDPGQARSQTYVGVEFVPGAGLSVASQIRAAQSRRHAAVESRRTAEKDTRDKIRSLQAESLSLKQQLKTTQGYVQSARSVAESFSRQFTIGRKSWLEVLNAVRESALAELSLAEVSWNSQLIDLRLAIEIGRITPDNFPNP